jgi:DNA-binding CsgD family transcriptional regulator
MESSLPFGLATQALEGLGAGHLFDESPHDVSPAGTRAGRLYGVLRWIANAGATPTLLALDDLHWADRDSMVLISFLARRIASLPVAILATLRPWPAEAERISSALERDRHAEVQRLAPLTVKGAGRLLADRVGRRLEDRVVRDAWSDCAGNPLLLEQVALAIRRKRASREGVAGDRGALSREPLLIRFAGLPPASLRLAEAASVFGTRFLPRLASRVAQLDEEQADAALESLWRNGLVRYTDHGWLEFVHPAFAQAAYENLGPLQGRFHARVFDVLLREGMEGEAAGHALRGHLVGNHEASRLLETLGRKAHASGALAAAVEYLQGALDLTTDGPAPELLLVVAEALVNAGRLRAAAAVLDRLLSQDEPGPDRRLKALLRMSTVLERLGDRQRAAACRREAIALAEGGGAAAAVAALLPQALSHWFGEGPSVSMPLLARASELADKAGPRARADTDWALGFVTLLGGSPAGLSAVESMGRSVEANLVSNLRELLVLWGPAQSYALALLLTERFADCERVSRTVRAAAERAGAPHAIGTIALVHMYALSRVGRLREARELAESVAPVIDLVPILAPFFGVGQAHVLLHEGRPHESARLCQEVEAAAVASGQNLAVLYLRDLVGHRELREGRPQEASDTYLRLEEAAAGMGIGEPCLVMWARHAIEAHVASDRRSDARRLLEWLEGRSAQLPCRWPRIAASCAKAWLAEAEGTQERAEACFRAALALHDETEPMPLERVETLLAYGSYLRRAGQPIHARPLLASAVALAEGVGAEWLAGHARRELKVAAGRRRPRGVPPGELTAQERRVADLVAKGMSNREIAGVLHLSVNTIQTHLRRAYDKLGIHSRQELVAMEIKTLKDHRDQ